jgi:hypothetical protein
MESIQIIKNMKNQRTKAKGKGLSLTFKQRTTQNYVI